MKIKWTKRKIIYIVGIVLVTALTIVLSPEDFRMKVAPVFGFVVVDRMYLSRKRRFLRQQKVTQEMLEEQSKRDRKI